MATKKAKKAEVKNPSSPFVFMDKTVNVLEIGLMTQKNVILYGPGGHGKSELTLDLLQSKGINPYVITMGTGMTTDRLFGGLDIPTFEATGKIEYLVENSFMNHPVVVFEELFDAPDFILEQLKDILSSKKFRNGTQVFDIKTEFIVCCTNRTREEFSKNMSLKALMERFPLEHNVIWDNYTEHSYSKLLESRFGEGMVDPIIPYILQEYHKDGITISPRVAITSYDVYSKCGPDALSFIAEFAKKPTIIAEAIKKFESSIKFRELSSEITILAETLKMYKTYSGAEFDKTFAEFINKFKEVEKITVTDDNVNLHSKLIKASKALIDTISKQQIVGKMME